MIRLLKLLFLALLTTFVVMSCGPDSHKIKMGDPVTIRLSPGGYQARNLFSTTDCKLPISHVVATSAKYGTVSADLPASIDLTAVSNALPGQSIITFGDMEPLTLSASDDWVFQYVGVYSPSCNLTGPLYMTSGTTKPTSVMSPDTKVSIEVDSLTNMALVMTSGGGSPVPSGGVFSEVTLSLLSSRSGSCNGSYTLKLKDGTTFEAAPVTYSLFASAGAGPTFPATAVLEPLPKNMSFVLTLSQTIGASSSPGPTVQINFTTGSADNQAINIGAISGFCP